MGDNKKAFNVRKIAQPGAALQTYNNELVKCVEELISRRDELSQEISLEEEEKIKVSHEIEILSQKLAKINESLARKQLIKKEYDRTIEETETAYMKILESSQMLLNVVKKEATTLKSQISDKNIQKSATQNIIEDPENSKFKYNSLKSLNYLESRSKDENLIKK